MGREHLNIGCSTLLEGVPFVHPTSVTIRAQPPYESSSHSSLGALHVLHARFRRCCTMVTTRCPSQGGSVREMLSWTCFCLVTPRDETRLVVPNSKAILPNVKPCQRDDDWNTWETRPARAIERPGFRNDQPANVTWGGGAMYSRDVVRTRFWRRPCNPHGSIQGKKKKKTCGRKGALKG